VHDSVRDLVPALIRSALKRPAKDLSKIEERSFWALRNVSFDVPPGRALGIIGSNGAGKSTILKVITQILEPTHGEAEVRGRVGALIELAAGFHPDLTGRENVFLQGSFMGMLRSEIARKFDQIVDFAGIEPFIDTPVKRYSSGMNARLGFAIAAHLDPDVLIIDEVLSVGDAAFQRKALDRVKELVRRDIPVVVVSHQLDQIVELCTDAIVMEHGRIQQRGTPGECVARYLERTMHVSGTPGAGAIHVVSVETPKGTMIESGRRITLNVECSVRDSSRTDRETVAVRMRNAEGTILFSTDAVRGGSQLPDHGWFWFDFSLQLNVPPGVYMLELYTWDEVEGVETEPGPNVGVHVTEGPGFSGVLQPNVRSLVKHGHIFGEAGGWIRPDLSARRETLEAEDSS
jgi:ABC-type polysaccharide/polyol phosphate transport system ATPase subunit